MNRRIYIYVFLIAISFSIIGCKSYRYTKKATKLEVLGQHVEAANLYYQALVANRTNIDAVAGLSRTGQISLDKKLSKFNQAYNNQNNKEGVYLYEDAKKYYDKILGVGVELNFPNYYNDYYNEVKNTFIEDLYYKGIKLIDEEHFEQAEPVFKEIVKLNPNYKDSKEKLITAIYEPKYRYGLRKIEEKAYRNAYYIFDEIIKKAGAYKNSYDLKKECLRKGSVTVFIKPVVGYSVDYDLRKTVQSEIMHAITETDNPFIKIIDANNGNNGAENCDITLSCEITDYRYDKGELEKIEQRGYLRKHVKTLNKSTESYEYKTEYGKVVYYEYEMSRSVSMTYLFKLVDNKSGEILATESKNSFTVDKIHYARYNGNHKNLVPGYWKYKKISNSADRVYDNQFAVQKLQELMRARSVIKNYNTLSAATINKASKYISVKINNFVNEN